MRILFLGDVVGRPGRNVVADRLPGLRERWRLDCVVVNGEKFELKLLPAGILSPTATPVMPAASS